MMLGIRLLHEHLGFVVAITHFRHWILVLYSFSYASRFNLAGKEALQSWWDWGNGYHQPSDKSINEKLSGHGV